MAGRPSALVSDESALKACIRDDALYKLTIFTFYLYLEDQYCNRNCTGCGASSLATAGLSCSIYAVVFSTLCFQCSPLITFNVILNTKCSAMLKYTYRYDNFFSFFLYRCCDSRNILRILFAILTFAISIVDILTFRHFDFDIVTVDISIVDILTVHHARTRKRW